MVSCDLHSLLGILVRSLGPLFIAFALVIIGGMAFVFFELLLPIIVRPHTVAYYAHVVIASFIVFNVLFNYILTVKTNPGTPDNAPLELTYMDHSSAIEEGKVELLDKDEELVSTRRLMSSSTADSGPKVGWGFCKKCQKPKPPRSHHCQICKTCVLQMDHHCPWVHNCIGYYNLRYFVNFLIYVVLGCIYVALSSAGPLFVYSPNKGRLGRQHSSMAFLCFFLAVFVGLTVGGLLVWNMYLVLTAQTVIEYYMNKPAAMRLQQRGQMFMNEYDLGCRRNFEQVFGVIQTHWILQFLPSCRPPPSPVIPRGIRHRKNADRNPRGNNLIL